MRRKVLARIVRSAVERLEARMFLSATLNAGAGSGTISGLVYNDLNGNAHLDPTEPPVATGPTVTLAQIGVNYNGVAPPSVMADVNGNFTFTGLAAGFYQLSLTPDVGFSAEPPGQLVVSVTNNAVVNLNVGESAVAPIVMGTATIMGTVFYDPNQTGIYTPGTSIFLSGDAVYLDLNGNGVNDPGEPIAATDSVGHYSFSVAPGSYDIRIIPRPQANFHQNSPGYLQVTVYAGDVLTANVGENDKTTVSGAVFQDLNGNGVQDLGDPAIAGETVYADDNFDGRPDAGEPTSTTDSSGHYVLTGLAPGFHRIRIQSNSGMLEDNLGYEDVTVPSRQDVVQNLAEGAPVTVTGVVYDDHNGNGVFDAGEMGLPNQTVFVDLSNNGVFDTSPVGPDGTPISNAEPSSVTAADGTFTVNNFGPGTYTLRITVPQGALPSGPANPTHSYTFTVGSGQSLATQNFGIQSPDLTVAFLSLPTKAVLSGTAERTIVRITNVGSLPAFGTSNVTLYAQTTAAAVNTTTASMIGGVGNIPIHLLPGQSKVVRFVYSFPIQTPTNFYFVTAGVSSTTVQDDNPANDFSATIGPISVVLPFIDLGITYVNAPDIPNLTVDPGHATALSLVVTNTGNVTTTGLTAFRIYLSQEPTVEPTDVAVAHFTVKNVRIRPGHSHVFVLTLPYPGPNLGVRWIDVAVDSGDFHGETDLVNNLVIPPNATLFH